MFFYDFGGADCTNFVSQCIWASYGGWIEGYDKETIEENLKRIQQNVRQVGGVWMGSHWNSGSNKWCRVNEFHNFVSDKNKYFGPFATSYGDKRPSLFYPNEIKKGDVLQFVIAGHNYNTYGHSIYVAQEGTSWDKIRICCHSSDRKLTPLSEFINDITYPKMRRLRFKNGRFENRFEK